MESVRATARVVPPPQEACRAQICAQWDLKIKPRGSLGRLEELAAWVGAVQETDTPRAEYRSVRLFAGSHGVTAEGVSVAPDAVNGLMLQAFHDGAAAINTLCRSNGIDFHALDAGIEHPTANLRFAPAMTEEETITALTLGWHAVPNRADLFAPGEMGIGNTTPSAALLAALLQRPVHEIVGRGTGIDDEALARKQRVIEDALALHAAASGDPLHLLAAVGGREIAAMTGSILRAAHERIPVVLDGVIAGAAAAVAFALNPTIASRCLAGHRSQEPAHRAFLEHYEMEPVLDLSMRLGEGTGAVLAMGIVRQAVVCFREMATFEEIGFVL